MSESNKDNIDVLYSDYIHKSRYAKYLDSESRRESWRETVDRFCDNVLSALSDNEVRSIRRALLNKDVVPSMRALMTAGPALDRDHVAGYNCAYVAVDDRKVFDEIMYILMCGTGVGFSVERKYINELPTVADEFHPANTTIRVPDSRIGWATSFRKLISLLYDGFIPEIDYSNVREAGARLRTFGGRSSGPEPLKDLFDYTINLFQHAKGRKLNELECHDLVCKTAEIVVCGGVRRSALISLSNLTSDRMRGAKSGQWWVNSPHRALANNSVCFTEKPDVSSFLREWTSLYESKSGERGFFSRQACENELPERRENGHDWGTNPCSEIVLRNKQFCNLTEVIVRPEDDLKTLKRKVRDATIIGTVQSTYTDFRYLSKEWRTNCEEERLLGVSLTGIMDHPDLNGKNGLGKTESLLESLKDVAITTNKKYAKMLGIPASAAITCVKPSGTVSQLCGTSSGIHPRYSQFYIRRTRQDVKDPLSQHLIDQGVPYEVDVHNPSQYVFSWPIASPRNSVSVRDISAIEQLELWKVYNENWCEHKPSVSIYVREDEWIEVANWVYENFDHVSGISFFPTDDHVYKQAPYESIDKETYVALLDEFPVLVDLDGFNEETDVTTASQELACSGGACEL